MSEQIRPDGFHDECGVFGVFGNSEAATLTYLGLHALQHRGQEAAGICTVEDGELTVHRGAGLVQDVFSEQQLADLPGATAIGHVRYSTAGGSDMRNAQPLCAEFGGVAVGRRSQWHAN